MGALGLIVTAGSIWAAGMLFFWTLLAATREKELQAAREAHAERSYRELVSRCAAGEYGDVHAGLVARGYAEADDPEEAPEVVGRISPDGAYRRARGE